MSLDPEFPTDAKYLLHVGCTLKFNPGWNDIQQLPNLDVVDVNPRQIINRTVAIKLKGISYYYLAFSCDLMEIQKIALF